MTAALLHDARRALSIRTMVSRRRSRRRRRRVRAGARATHPRAARSEPRDPTSGSGSPAAGLQHARQLPDSNRGVIDEAHDRHPEHDVERIRGERDRRDGCARPLDLEVLRLCPRARGRQLGLVEVEPDRSRAAPGSLDRVRAVPGARVEHPSSREGPREREHERPLELLRDASDRRAAPTRVGCCELGHR